MNSIRQIEVLYNKQQVGRLALAKEGLCAFEYSAEIYRDGDWHFAPAYDLLPSDGINGFRTTSINDKIEPTQKDIIAVAIKAGLNEKEAVDNLVKIQNIIISK